MDDGILRSRIGANIVACRKRQGLTQAGLAEKLNYSDKAVSKWERGESVPDVLTLVQLSELFGVSVDALLSDPDALPEGEAPQAEEAPQERVKRKANKNMIQMLSSILVWSVSLLTFVVLASLGLPKSWIAFIYAIPVNAIVLLSLRSAWRMFSWNQALISGIVWGCILSLYVTLFIFAHANTWLLFLLGIPGQAAVFCWFRMFRPGRKEQQDG